MSASGPSDYFRDDVDRIDWLRRFTRTAAEFGWRSLAVCEMTTHWHALVEIDDSSLACGMHSLNSAYSRAFNARHGRVGYLVRDRYWSFRKVTAEEVLAAFRYVVANPKRAAMVDRCEDWFWSSWATTLGLADAFPFVDATPVLQLLSGDTAAALRALRAYVEDV